ncbi:hypothetical protein D3C77_796290 [compost metagenome]
MKLAICIVQFFVGVGFKAADFFAAAPDEVSDHLATIGSPAGFLAIGTAILEHLLMG